MRSSTSLTASLLAIEQRIARRMARARSNAWVLLLLSIVSVSPASLPILIGSAKTLSKLGEETAEMGFVDEALMKSTSSANTWYALGAMLALSQFFSSLVIFWLRVLLLHTAPHDTMVLVHWLLLCSPALIVNCIHVFWQNRSTPSLSTKLRPKQLLSWQQLQRFKEEVAKLQFVQRELFRDDEKHGLLERFKGDTHEMLVGRPDDAVRGLEHLMCVSEDEVRAGMLEGTAAIVREVDSLGDAGLQTALHNHAMPKVDALLRHERSVHARLREPHIIAIRLYTCAAGFQHFNDPLRDRERIHTRRAHPLPITTAFLAEGIRKLRLLYELEHGHDPNLSRTTSIADPSLQHAPSLVEPIATRPRRTTSTWSNDSMGHEGRLPAHESAFSSTSNAAPAGSGLLPTLASTVHSTFFRTHATPSPCHTDCNQHTCNEPSHETILYRGLHNLTLADSFLANCEGGTELAVCSTTTDFNIAVHFMLQSPSGLPTLPKEVLLLRIVVRNCNHFGGMISYLSVNPGDAEVIYPPLTYLEPTGNYQTRKVGSTRLTVIEVIPL